jgi:hypothetical protein
MQYFRAVEAIRFAENGIERDKAKAEKRRTEKVLQHSLRTDRNNKVALKLAKTRRRVDWNVMVF